MTDVRDVVVIGAGPAGGAAAIGLADRGRRVALVDRERFPRDKVCGGCLNPRAIRSLAALGVVPSGVPLRWLVLHAGGRTARVPLEGGLAVSRRSLDAALVDAARARGVEVIEGVAATLGPDGGDARAI
ncbi:MAG: NAD(P)/FAD-dependent oxidoreductase, partial [Planctomycetota bacterium JB042]